MLRFIHKPMEKRNNAKLISIHLMLRFIFLPPGSKSGKEKFQYISCYGLSRCHIIYTAIIFNFNTSHVTVYQKADLERRRDGFYFNTSHVTVYLSSYVFVCLRIVISIHLMLRFISFDPAVKSCLNYFNTSHVTVYHFMDIKDFTVMLEFQYISCYGLSKASMI